MKTMKRWRSLQITLAVIIAFSGICTFSTDTYSLFCRQNIQISNAIIQSSEGSCLQPDVCDAEQLSHLNARGMIEQIMQESRSGINYVRICTYSKRMLSVLTGTFLSGEPRYYYQSAQMDGSYVFVHSAWIIVDYIHHTDGAKG